MAASPPEGSASSSSGSNTTGEKPRRSVEVDEERRWAPGDQARLMGLCDNKHSPELQAVNSSLALLGIRQATGSWTVKIQGKEFAVRSENLRVCCQVDEERWRELFSQPWSQALLALAILGTLALLMTIHFTVQHVAGLAAAGGALVPGDGNSAEGGSAAVPGGSVAMVVSLAALIALTWAICTIGGCYAMHESLRDPEVAFPQISELGVGPAPAKALYRIGFASTAALLGALILLHQELALPHLPGGRGGDLGACFTFWGLLATGGVAAQGIFLLGADFSGQSALHGLGAMVFFYGVWCHMGAAQRLYLPGEQMPSEDSPAWDEVTLAADQTAASALLQHSLVHYLVQVRHYILMRAPLAVFVIPVFSQMSERVGTSAHAVTPRMRSLMGLAQWLVVFDFVLIFLSYAPELVVAALLPLPQTED